MPAQATKVALVVGTVVIFVNGGGALAAGWFTAPLALRSPSPTPSRSSCRCTRCSPRDS